MNVDVTLYGGPHDGQRLSVKEGEPLLIIRGMTLDVPALSAATESAPSMIPMTEYSYVRDKNLRTRYNYAGERQVT